MRSFGVDLRQIHPIAALCAVDVWGYLAWQDIRLRYRRSTIGPFWITLSMTIFCLSLGYVYSRLFKQNIVEYLPFVTASFVIWGFMASVMTEMPNVFVDSAPYIKDININPLIIVMRALARHVITFLHNAFIIVGIYLWFGIPPTPALWMFIPGFFLTLVTMTGVAVVLGIIGARFRDIAPITQSAVQVLFFITPITWAPSMLPKDSHILSLNPFAHLLEITRAPLLGNAPAPGAWTYAFVACGMSVFCAAAAYRIKARELPFWV
jgi:ABC-type polysaccharide/polyol phosphate export permease